MNSYGCAVYAHGIELHGDGRRRERGPLGWLYLRPALPRARGPRGEIRGFSVKSRQRLKWALANAVPEFRTHLTLTYHARVDESDADAAAARNRSLVSRAKRDLNRFLACVRREAGRYCWIQEFQSRGAVHFHVLVESVLDSSRAALAWCRATGQLHDPHALRHGVRVDAVEDQLAARRYLVRYFGKSVQKRLPAGVERAGRFWGASRSLIADPMAVVTSCEPKGKRHDASAVRVVRGLRRFVSGVVGFRWRGGRLVSWRGDLSVRALHVLGRLREYYGETGVLVEQAQRSGWELATPDDRNAAWPVGVMWIRGADDVDDEQGEGGQWV